MRIRRVVSGGQTGVDRAALEAALAYGVPIGGWCPRGRRAEDGPISERYPLRETPSEQYAQRTAWNVRDSDGTLILVPGDPEGGTALTVDEARQRDKPLLQVNLKKPPDIEQIMVWIEANDIHVLNVAGPRASEAPGVYEQARHVITRLLQRMADD